MEIIAARTNFDFMGKARYALFLSAVMVIGSIYIFISQGAKKYGVDFTGGHQLVVETAEAAKVDSEKLRAALSKQGLGEAVVQDFEATGGTRKFAVRIGAEVSEGEAAEEAASKAVKAKVAEALKAFEGTSQIVATEFVGPTIGAELKRNAIIAVALGMLAIMGYITYRFEFAFALGAVAAVFHDVIVATGIYLLTQSTLSMSTLAAVLTVLGYSVNDTIVVFDRVREQMMRAKKFDLPAIFNESINFTLSRTIITSVVTQFMAMSLLLYGGGAIADLSILLVVGIFVGCYSTIFIASPVALLWENFANPLPASEEPAKAQNA